MDDIYIIAHLPIDGITFSETLLHDGKRIVRMTETTKYWYEMPHGEHEQPTVRISEDAKYDPC